VHYNQGGIECIDAIRSCLGPDGFAAYCQGNIIKYTWRYNYKGKSIQDLEKARWYAKRIQAELEPPDDDDLCDY